MCSAASAACCCCCWPTASTAVMTGHSRITQWLLGLGMLFSLFKGFDWESALLLGASCSSSPCRPLFYRKGSLLHARFTPSWLMSVGPCCWGLVVAALLLPPCGVRPLPLAARLGPRARGRLPCPARHGERHRRAGGGRGGPSAGPLRLPVGKPDAEALSRAHGLVMRAGGRPRLPGPARGQVPAVPPQRRGLTHVRGRGQ